MTAGTEYREADHPRAADGKWRDKSDREPPAPRAGKGRHRRPSVNRFLVYAVATTSATVVLLGAYTFLRAVIAVLLVVLAVSGLIIGLLRGAQYLGTKTERSSFGGSLSPRRRAKLKWWHVGRRAARWLKGPAERWHAFEQRRAANRFI